MFFILEVSTNGSFTSKRAKKIVPVFKSIIICFHEGNMQLLQNVESSVQFFTRLDYAVTGKT